MPVGLTRPGREVRAKPNVDCINPRIPAHFAEDRANQVAEFTQRTEIERCSGATSARPEPARVRTQGTMQKGLLPPMRPMIVPFIEYRGV